MTRTDEQALSRRLHQELDALPAPAAPVAAVLRRGAARAGPGAGSRPRPGWSR